MISKDSYIEIADSILESIKDVSKGNLIYIKNQKSIPKRIKLVDNFKYFENERGFILLNLEKHFNNKKDAYQSYSKFILLKQEVFSNTIAICANNNRKLNIYRVNLIQTILEAPSTCKEIIVSF